MHMKSEDVALEIRRSIRQGVLKPGEELVQEQVAAKLAVSRIPLREALQSLAAAGLVTAHPGRGFRVAKLDAGEVSELYGLRIQIEPGLAPAMIANASPAEITRLGELETSIRAAAGPQEWAQLNYLFHVELYKLACAPHSLRIIRQLLDLVAPYSTLYVHGHEGDGYEGDGYEGDGHEGDGYEGDGFVGGGSVGGGTGSQARAEAEHGEMVAALAAGNPDELADQIRLHLVGARDSIVRHMSTTTETDLVTRLADLHGDSEHSLVGRPNS